MNVETIETGKKVIKLWKISLVFLGFSCLFGLSTIVLAQFHFLYSKNLIITVFAFISMLLIIITQYTHIRKWKSFLRKNIHLFTFNPDYVLNVTFAIILFFLSLIPIINLLLSHIGTFNPLWIVIISGAGVVACTAFGFLKISQVCKKLNNSIK